MPLTINSNIASLNAQRRLAQSTVTLQQSFVQLSSGLRINKASDDAAGLAISSSLNVDSRVYTQGVRNANDAESFFAIAGGALSSLVNITTRLKELAQQSSNGVLSYAQRKSLDVEAQALGKEYQRIRQTAQFNGQRLLDNSQGILSVQAGYSALGLAGGSAPDGTFASPNLYSTGADPLNFTSGDLNNDGYADLVSADGTSNQISVLLGNGDGSFKARQAYGSGNSPRYVTVADLNGDRVLDVIAAEDAVGQLGVYLGNGDGSFKASRAYSNGSVAPFVTTADVNGDGSLDMVAVNNSTNHLNILLGNGDGTFRARRSYAAGTAPYAAAAADFNRDGVVDIATAQLTPGFISVFIGNGDGSFLTRATYAASTTNISIMSADLNEDGISDLVANDLTGQQVSVFIGNGDGTFRARRDYAANGSPSDFTAADYNADGILDLVSIGGGRLSLFQGNGDGTFKVAQTYTAGTTVLSVAATDVNGDGGVDLIFNDTAADALGVLLGNGSAQAIAGTPLGQYTLLSKQNSLKALTQFSQVLDRLTASLGQAGANESRLHAVINVMQQTRINYDSAASQIRDVDVATEAANLAKGNILQQAGAAVLAQANQQPGLALQLLRTF